MARDQDENISFGKNQGIFTRKGMCIMKWYGNLIFRMALAWRIMEFGHQSLHFKWKDSCPMAFRNLVVIRQDVSWGQRKHVLDFTKIVVVESGFS